jgi:hypothetical protein
VQARVREGVCVRVCVFVCVCGGGYPLGGYPVFGARADVRKRGRGRDRESEKERGMLRMVAGRAGELGA